MIELIKKAETLAMDYPYPPFKFPLKANDDSVIFCFDTLEKPLHIHRDGMTLLLQNLYEYVDRNHAKALYAKSKPEFVAYINSCRTKQEENDLWRKDQIYFLAINNGVVHGVMANYNPKSNLAVLKEIEESGLSMRRHTLNTKEMNLYFTHHIKDGFEVGLNVRNGETGYASFSYRLYVYNNDYTFSTPLWSKRKHLGMLEEATENLVDLFSEIKDIQFIEFIKTAEAKPYAQLITEKYEKLSDLVQPFDSRLKKLYTLLGMLHSQHEVKGFKTVTKKALDDVYKLIMENMNNGAT